MNSNKSFAKNFQKKKTYFPKESLEKLLQESLKWTPAEISGLIPVWNCVEISAAFFEGIFGETSEELLPTSSTIIFWVISQESPEEILREILKKKNSWSDYWRYFQRNKSTGIHCTGIPFWNYSRNFWNNLLSATIPEKKSINPEENLVPFGIILLLKNFRKSSK